MVWISERNNSKIVALRFNVFSHCSLFSYRYFFFFIFIITYTIEMIILVINIHSISFSILTYETYEKHVVFFFFLPSPSLLFLSSLTEYFTYF